MQKPENPEPQTPPETWLTSKAPSARSGKKKTSQNLSPVSSNTMSRIIAIVLLLFPVLLLLGAPMELFFGGDAGALSLKDLSPALEVRALQEALVGLCLGCCLETDS